jgi:hypothetical protein
MQRDVESGDHLLVTGAARWGGAALDDPIAWECGFTTVFSRDRANEWAGALGSK